MSVVQDDKATSMLAIIRSVGIDPLDLIMTQHDSGLTVPVFRPR